MVNRGVDRIPEAKDESLRAELSAARFRLTVLQVRSQPISRMLKSPRNNRESIPCLFFVGDSF